MKHLVCNKQINENISSAGLLPTDYLVFG